MAFSFMQKQMLTTLRAALDRWIELVRTTNEQAKLRDRLRWQLHAAASMDADLQAWYHSLFFREV
jgi:hypothetical protein